MLHRSGLFCSSSNCLHFFVSTVVLFMHHFAPCCKDWQHLFCWKKLRNTVYSLILLQLPLFLICCVGKRLPCWTRDTPQPQPSAPSPRRWPLTKVSSLEQMNTESYFIPFTLSLGSYYEQYYFFCTFYEIYILLNT